MSEIVQTTTTGGNLGLGPAVGTRLFTGGSNRPEGLTDDDWAQVQQAYRTGDAAKAEAILAKAGVAQELSFHLESVRQLRLDIRGVAKGADRSVKRGIVKRARALDRTDLIPDGWAADIEQATTSTDMGFAAVPGPHGGVKSAGTKGTGEVGGYADDELRRKQKLTQPGKPAITDQKSLKSAIRDALTAGDRLDPRTARHITARAYALGFSALIPTKGLMAEEARRIESLPKDKDGVHVLAPFLMLEQMGLPAPAILQEASPDNGGRMKIRVPFFVGNSVSVVPGFDKRFYFGAELLPGITQEAKSQIAAKRQPLNVYARHKHAMTGDHLPIGAIVDVESEGRVGYATIELEPIVPDGVNAMTLIRGKKLNAVSLRSREGQFELEEKRINGEHMYMPTRMAICGVDFAPDSPAMPTYGVETLAAEARVEDMASSVARKPKTRRLDLNEDITLELLQKEHSEIVAEIEAPLRKEIKSITAERDALVGEKKLVERDAKIREVADQFPEPEKALPLLQEFCKDVKSADEVITKAWPVLTKALKSKSVTQEQPLDEKLLALFPQKPAGAGDQTAVVAESGNAGTGVQQEMAGNMPVPA